MGTFIHMIKMKMMKSKMKDVENVMKHVLNVQNMERDQFKIVKNVKVIIILNQMKQQEIVTLVK